MGAQHRIYSRAGQEREEADKQRRLEELGANFRLHRLTGWGKEGHAPCRLCEQLTLRRVSVSPALSFPLCSKHDDWDAASLCYVEGLDGPELVAAYAERESARKSR